MSSSEQRLYEQALGALNTGNFVEAERQFRKFLRRQPNHVGALNLIGIVLTHLKHYDAAEEFLSRAIRADGRSDVSFYNYGFVLKNLGKLEAAHEPSPRRWR